MQKWIGIVNPQPSKATEQPIGQLSNSQGATRPIIRGANKIFEWFHFCIITISIEQLSVYTIMFLISRCKNKFRHTFSSSSALLYFIIIGLRCLLNTDDLTRQVTCIMTLWRTEAQKKRFTPPNTLSRQFTLLLTYLPTVIYLFSLRSIGYASAEQEAWSLVTMVVTCSLVDLKFESVICNDYSCDNIAVVV